MRRHVLSLLVVFAGCGVGVEAEAPPSEEVASTLTPAQPSLPEPENELRASGVTAANGAQVRWLLGYLSCGIIELGHGEATVTNGSFTVPYDPEQASALPFAKLYAFVDVNGDGRCEDGVDSVLQGDVTAPNAVVTLSAEDAGCWLADSVIVRIP